MHLINKITKEQAEGDAERAAYYIGYFDADRKLVRVVKMFGGHMVFEQKYSYYPNGRLKREEGRNQSGTVTVLEFDESGKLKK